MFVLVKTLMFWMPARNLIFIRNLSLCDGSSLMPPIR